MGWNKVNEKEVARAKWWWLRSETGNQVQDFNVSVSEKWKVVQEREALLRAVEAACVHKDVMSWNVVNYTPCHEEK